MSKQLRTLVIAGVAVVALVALLLVLLFVVPQPAEEVSSSTVSSDTSVTLVDKTKDGEGETVSDPVTSVQITTADGSFTVSRNEDGNLAVEEFADLPLNTSQLSVLENNLKTITASQEVVANAENIEDFGFGGEGYATLPTSGDEDSSKVEQEDGILASVTVTYHDDTTYSFEISREAPSKEGYYFREAGTSTVYLVDYTFTTAMLHPALDYIGTNIVTAPDIKDDDENGSVVMRDMELSGTVRDQVIDFRQATEEDNDTLNYSGYVITKPYFKNGDSSTTGLMSTLKAYTSVSADGVAKARPAAEDLESYGLTNPYSRAVFNLAVYTYTNSESETSGEETETVYSYYNVTEYDIKLGNKNEDGQYYALVAVNGEEIPVIYLLSEDSVPWAEAQYDDLADTMLFQRIITDVSDIAMTINGEKTVFHLEHFPDEEDRDEMMKVTVDGVQYSTPDFRTLYQDLLMIARTGKAPGEPQGDPVLVLDMTPLPDSEDEPIYIEIYKYDPNVYIVKHPSGETYAVAAKTVTYAMEQIQRYLNGETVY